MKQRGVLYPLKFEKACSRKDLRAFMLLYGNVSFRGAYVIRQHGDCPKYDQARRKPFKKYLKSPSESVIIGVQRVAFLRKSSCGAATRLFYGIG